MADNSFPIEVSRNDSANASTNGIWVQLTDGTNAVTFTGSSLNVAVTNLGKAEDAAHVSGDTGVMSLAVRNDAGTALAGTDGDYIPLSTDANGNLRVTVAEAGKTDDSAFTVGTDKVTPIGAYYDDTTPDTVDEGDVGLIRMTADRKVLTRVVGASDANRLDIDASGHAQVDLAAVSVTAVPISANASANSPTNPVYVYVTDEDGATSTEVHSQSTDTVASAATVNHDYSVVGTYFQLKKVTAGSSAGCKIEVQTGPALSLVTQNVAFLPKGQGGYIEMNFNPAKRVPVTSSGTVRVAKTNLQGSSNDIHTTIMGNDYA